MDKLVKLAFRWVRQVKDLECQVFDLAPLPKRIVKFTKPIPARLHRKAGSKTFLTPN